MFGSFLHSSFNLSITCYFISGDALYIHAHLLALSYLQSIWWPFACVDEQVLHFFVVYLEHADCYFKLFFPFDFCSLNALEYFLACHGYDSSISLIADHRIRFSSPCLPVREKTAIKSIPQ